MEKKAPPSANAEDKKKQKKKIREWGSNLGPYFAFHHSNHYSIPPSLDNEVEIAYIKKHWKYFFELEKNSLNKICRQYRCKKLGEIWSPCDQYFCQK